MPWCLFQTHEGSFVSKKQDWVSGWQSQVKSVWPNKKKRKKKKMFPVLCIINWLNYILGEKQQALLGFSALNECEVQGIVFHWCIPRVHLSHREIKKGQVSRFSCLKSAFKFTKWFLTYTFSQLMAAQQPIRKSYFLHTEKNQGSGKWRGH